MSLPKRLYEAFCELKKCELVSQGTVTDKTLTEFENLLNNAQPQNDAERHYRDFARSMYYSDTTKFLDYVCDRNSKVKPVIVWTESKRIVEFFNLMGKVYISWDRDNSTYKAHRYDEKLRNNRGRRGRGGKFYRNVGYRGGYRGGYRQRNHHSSRPSSYSSSAATHAPTTKKSNDRLNTRDLKILHHSEEAEAAHDLTHQETKSKNWADMEDPPAVALNYAKALKSAPTVQLTPEPTSAADASSAKDEAQVVSS